ncbi:MAG: Glucose/sorbosone dehydrogenase-like protein [Ilumatobacteraceae bacterium]|nr:Glucose/sorbosone dehydrogenase-like protein [Ilumatobacteraceae bacterium]
MLLCAGVVLGLAAASCGADPSTASSTSTSVASAVLASSRVDIGAGLSGVSGLSATQYATGLLHVSALAFDSSGRLWAATASLAADGSDGLYVITASGAKPTEVVSTLSTPLGLLWVGDELFVSSAGKVEAYSGFDGTKFATVRTVVTFPDGVGEVNQMALSPSGRILLGISSPCNACDLSTTAAEDETAASPYSASIVSFEPDGSDLQVYASDIRAAVGLAFYPGTDILFATMNQRDDLGDATPGDLLATVEEGQSWGFPNCYGQGGTDCADQPAAVAELDRHAAVSGVAIVTGQLGSATTSTTGGTTTSTTGGTAAIVAEWSTGELVSVPLDAAAPASASTGSVFITGLQSPVAVIAGPDGALYTGDWTTGIVYRITAATT